MKFRAEIEVTGKMAADLEAESQEEADEILQGMIVATQDGGAGWPWQHYNFIITGKRVMKE